MHTKYCFKVLSWLRDDQLTGPSAHLRDRPSSQKKQKKKEVFLITFDLADLAVLRFAAMVATWFVKVQIATSVAMRVLEMFFTPLPSICFPILLRCCSFAPACRSQHSVATPCNLMHPHDVHDVQTDTGADPGHAASPGYQVEGLGAVDCIHTTVVHWHDSDADHKKDCCHGDAVCHIGPGWLGVS